MADVAINPQAVQRTGITPTYTPVVSGNTYFVPNGPSTILHFRYSGAGTALITLISPGTVAGLAIADATVGVAAGTEKFIVADPRSAFNDAQGRLGFSVNTASDLDVCVLQGP